MMTHQEFTDLLGIYGADFSRWPHDKLKPALLLTEKDTDARAAFDRMVEMESGLRMHNVPQVDMTALEKRILAAVADMPQSGVTAAVSADVPRRSADADIRWRPAMFFAPSGGFLALALCGFFMGAQPAMKQESLVNKVYAQTEQILVDDSGLYDGRIF